MSGITPLPAYLVDKVTGERFEFQYVDGATLNDEIIGGLWDMRIIGSTHPRIGYGAGGGRVWTMKLKFYNEVEDTTWCMQQVRWLQARLLPEYGPTGLMKNPPHLCIFTWGDLIDAQVAVRQVKAKYGPLYTPGELRPIMAEVDLRVDEYELGSIGFNKLNPNG